MKPFKAVVLSLCLVLAFPACAHGDTLGPARTYHELLSLISQASDGDTLLIEGELSAAGYQPLTPDISLHITSSGEGVAVIRELQLHNAKITFSNVELLDSLDITGSSYIELGRNVTVRGASGKSGVSFVGNGELLIDRDCSIVGGNKSNGVSVSQQDGSLYVGVEGSIKGGSSGGTGMIISPLTEMGTMMISGAVTGGDSSSIGGHALNLYNLSGNAFVTINGTVQGGPGAVGGDGIQLVDVTDNVSIGIDGSISGGKGQDFGGDALMLLNVDGGSSVNLAGSLTGGDVTAQEGQPGTSLLVVGERSSVRTMPETVLLSGNNLAAVETTPEPTSTPEPEITPLPEIPTSVIEPEALTTPISETSTEAPLETPAPEQSTDSTPAVESTPSEAQS